MNRKSLLATGLIGVSLMFGSVACEVPEESKTDPEGVSKGIGVSDASKDVKLGKMESSFGTVRIPATITNPTSKASSYHVEVTLYDKAGAHIGTADAYVQRVQPKSKAKTEVLGFPSGKTATYKLTQVERTASY